MSFVEGDAREASCSVFNSEAHFLVCFSDGGICVSIPGLVSIKDAHDIETRLNEVEKLLKAVISMPRKVGARGGRGRTGGAGARFLEASGGVRCKPREGRLLGLWGLRCFLPGEAAEVTGSRFTGSEGRWTCVNAGADQARTVPTVPILSVPGPRAT